MEAELEATKSAPDAAGRRTLLDWPFPRFMMAGALASEFFAIGLFVGPTPANAVFVVPFLLPILVLCGLALWKRRPWMYLAGGITLVIFPTLILAFSTDSFTVPQLGLVFDAGMFLLLALFLGLPSGVWVFAHRKDGPPFMSARDGLRTRFGVVSVLVGGMLLGSALAGEAAHFNATAGAGVNAGSDLSPEAWLNVTAQNYLFVPSNVSVPLGKIVEVTVENKDSALHTFTYTVHGGTPEERTYTHNLLPSSTTTFTILLSQPGAVDFWCVPHRSTGMVGTLNVA